MDIQEYLRRIKAAESSNNRFAVNKQKGQTASGLYQFTKGTWENLGFNWADRFNAGKQQEAAIKFTNMNLNGLKKAGVSNPTYVDLYGAHFMGLDGYKEFLKHSDNTLVTSFMPSGVIRPNPNMLFDQKTNRPFTVGEVKQKLSERVNTAPTKAGGHQDSEKTTDTEFNINDYRVEEHHEAPDLSVSKEDFAMNSLNEESYKRDKVDEEIKNAEESPIAQNEFQEELQQQQSVPQRQFVDAVQAEAIEYEPLYQDGGSIPISSRGVYDYPNQKVIVPTNGNITMKNVDYPILGQSLDTGEKMLMQPGQEYYFENTKKVLETPMFQNGGQKPVSQVWTETTGLPWSEAKKQGKTDGSYSQNIKLRRELLSNGNTTSQNPVPRRSNTTVSQTSNDSYISAEDYRNKIATKYSNYFESNDFTPPTVKVNGVDTGDSSMNCINGVCQVIKATTGKRFRGTDLGTYTGNATFLDNINKEGYLIVDPKKDGFEVGDIIQYTTKKSNAVRFNGSINNKNINEMYPTHATVILEKVPTADGYSYKIGNNNGHAKMQVQDLSHQTLIDRYRTGAGFEGDDSYNLIRYDPDKAYGLARKKKEKYDAINGINDYSGEYTKGIQLSKDFRTEEYSKTLAPIMKGIQESYAQIGKGSNMPRKTFDKLIDNQLAIAAVETEYGGFTKRNIAKTAVKLADAGLSINPVIKDYYNPGDLIKGVRRMSSGTSWTKDYWNKNADNVRSEFRTYDEFKKTIDTGDKEDYVNSELSKGWFQQKELSERGKIYGFNFDSPENQAKASLALAVDNYHKLKEKYPNKTEDELVELTTLMHNAPTKALNERFVNYYYKNKDVDYLKRVSTVIKNKFKV